MDIDDIEDNLNNYEVDIKNLLNLILDNAVLNQALLKVVMDNQLLIMKLLRPQIDTERIADENYERIISGIAEIQALIAKKF